MKKGLKTFYFSVILISLSLFFVGLFLFGLDVYLHHKFEKSAGLNTRGYRGTVVSKKQENEWRIVMLGGSTVFGYGVKSRETIPYYLEQILRQRFSTTSKPVVNVINLGLNNQGAYSFRPNLEDYLPLQYDLAIFYEGYNDLGGNVDRDDRRESLLFRTFGYLPILPIILREKAMLLMAGKLDSAYQGKVIFQPGLIDKAKATSMQATATLLDTFDKGIPKVAESNEERYDDCGGRWGFYCHYQKLAIDYALSQGKCVLVVSQPYLKEVHQEQQTRIREMLEEFYSNETRLKYLNLGEAIILKGNPIAYDGMHLTAEGNQLIAEKLAPAVEEILKSKGADLVSAPMK